jgi:hypothetical protein
VAVGGEVELTMVTMVFTASDADALLPVLAKYVVLSRGQDGCRNIDLCASATEPNRFDSGWLFCPTSSGRWAKTFRSSRCGR